MRVPFSHRDTSSLATVALSADSQSEIAAPLGLDFFIGLPASERGRVSRMVYKQALDLAAASPESIPLESIPEEFRELVAAVLDPDSLYNRAFSVTDPAQIDFNLPEVQAAEIPASIGTARGLARMYAALVGEVDGVRLLTPETLASATSEQAAGADRVLVLPSRFGSGYMLPTEAGLMLGPSSFGHPGRGGSLGFADPEHGIGFGYVMNHVIEGDPGDVRAMSLVDAVRKSLA